MGAPGMTIKEALELLDAGDADGVAVVLHSLDANGRAGNALRCPLARALRQLTGRDRVCVGGGSADVFNAPFESAPLPPAVNDFVDAFDAGQYPELVEA